MLFRLCLIGPVLAAGIIFAPGARADDAAVEAIKKAIQIERAMVAYRIKETRTQEGEGLSEITIEVVNPDQVHLREVMYGKVKRELITDGKRLFVREGPDGELKEEPRDTAKKIKSLQDEAMISPPKPRDDVKLTRHETVKGVPVSIYTWISAPLIVTTRTLQIGDKDNRLIEEWGEGKGEFPFMKQTVKVDVSWDKKYESDPSIKIALPTPGAP